MPDPSSFDSLSGRIALVTGASRGIGRSIAQVLASAGVRVALAARNRERLDQVAAEIHAFGGAASVHLFDASEPAATERLVDEVERAQGPLDLLVNNAAINGAGAPFAASAMNAWWQVFEINVRAPALLCRAALPGMIARGTGRIVNVSSGLANMAMPNTSDYSASKAALTRLTESIGVELAGTGVFVFAISPGMVKTDMTRAIAALKEWKDWDAPEAAGRLCAAIASGRLDRLSGRFFGVREGIDALIAATDEILAQDMQVLRMKRIGMS